MKKIIILIMLTIFIKAPYGSSAYSAQENELTISFTEYEMFINDLLSPKVLMKLREHYGPEFKAMGNLLLEIELTSYVFEIKEKGKYDYKITLHQNIDVHLENENSNKEEVKKVEAVFTFGINGLRNLLYDINHCQIEILNYEIKPKK